MEKRNKGKIVVLILAILLLLVVAGVTVCYFTGDNNKRSADEDSAAETQQQEKEETPKAEDITVEPTAAPKKDYGEIADEDTVIETSKQEKEEPSKEESGVIYQREEVDGKERCIISYLDSEGRLYQQEVRDEEEKLLSIVSIHAGSGEEVYRFEYEYDEAGNLSVMKERYGENGEEYITRYENSYDEAGNLRKSVTLDRDGKPWEYTVYDEQGRVIEELCHESDSEFTVSRTYEEDGSMTEVMTTGEDESLTEEFTNITTYDARGNMLTAHRKLCYRFGSDVSRSETYETYVYDENDRILEYTSTDMINGSETKRVNSYSMEDNVLIRETVQYTNGEITDHEIVHSTYEKTDRKTH